MWDHTPATAPVCRSALDDRARRRHRGGADPHRQRDRDVVGLEPAYRLEERNVAFLWIGGRSGSMLGLWAGSSSPNAPPRLHLAFSLDLKAVLAAPATLRGRD